jgi:hypothetical protein
MTDAELHKTVLDTLGDIAPGPDDVMGEETATFEVRAGEVANPHPGDQLAVGSESFAIQGEPERRDPDRLVWTLDLRPA